MYIICLVNATSITCSSNDKTYTINVKCMCIRHSISHQKYVVFTKCNKIKGKITTCSWNDMYTHYITEYHVQLWSTFNKHHLFALFAGNPTILEYFKNLKIRLEENWYFSILRTGFGWRCAFQLSSVELIITKHDKVYIAEFHLVWNLACGEKTRGG